MKKYYTLFLFFVIVFLSLNADAGRTRRPFRNKNMSPKKTMQQTSLPLPPGIYEGYDTCRIYKEPVEVELLIDLGKPKYINSLSGTDFPAKPYSTTMGLTTAYLKTEMNATNFVQEINHQTVCLGLKKLIVKISYPDIKVFIDKKYRPGSCPYKVIREHENYHVRVHQEGLNFFSKKIKEAFVIAANKIDPIQISDSREGEKAFEGMIQAIQKDVAPLLSYVEYRIKEQNMVIDTKSSYEKDASKCQHW